jgi:hypothetical protein
MTDTDKKPLSDLLVVTEDHDSLYKIKQDHLNKMIAEKHNPKLVIRGESPNKNKIYHIYNNGQITHQKGGRAYLERNEFVEKYSISSQIKTLDFPMVGDSSTIGIKYAIVTLNDAISIREKMIEFLPLNREFMIRERSRTQDIRLKEIKELEIIREKIKNEINEMIIKLHDSKSSSQKDISRTDELVNIYTDGKIASQGGYYSIESIKMYPISDATYINHDCNWEYFLTDDLELPGKVYPVPVSSKGIRYATMSYDNAKLIRNKMIEYINVRRQIIEKKDW